AAPQYVEEAGRQGVHKNIEPGCVTAPLMLVQRRAGSDVVQRRREPHGFAADDLPEHDISRTNCASELLRRLPIGSSSPRVYASGRRHRPERTGSVEVPRYDVHNPRAPHLEVFITGDKVEGCDSDEISVENCFRIAAAERSYGHRCN